MFLKTKIEEVIEITNHDTGEKKFLLLKDGEWINVNEKQYNIVLEGEKDDRIQEAADLLSGRLLICTFVHLFLAIC